MIIQLDSGYDGDGGLITYEAVKEHLELDDSVIPSEELVCLCLNGQELRSKGIITLRWKGEGFRKVFKTTFHVIEGEFLPFQMLLGAQAIHEHGILKFAGFGGRAVHPKKSTADAQDIEEKSIEKNRREEHRKKAAANDKKVSADKSAQNKSSPKEDSKRRL
ncbi:hypothetical protein LARI1_G002094 [Lachnellula arida]|uniref:Uncharacterized protein n=1 Tax=Lachnellula arida TaxID=1316785 RepID=A0A8T9BJP3_9HELO|nr:hypothetical protein LARI1_G002094 [Lachnellula arida]